MREYRGSVAGVPWVGHVVERPADLHPFMEWVRAQRQSVTFDLETCGLGIYTYGPGFVRLAQFGHKTEAWAVPVEYGQEFVNAVRQALETLPVLNGHNVISFDGLASDRHLGFSLESMCAKTTDSMILAKLIDPRQPQDGGIGASLKPLAAHYVDPSAPDTQQGLHEVFASYGYTKKSGEGWANVPLTDATYERYALLDTVIGTHVLEALQAEHKRLNIHPGLVEYEHNIIRMTATMTRNAMLVDQEYSRGLDGKLADDALAGEQTAAEWGVENINSTRQIADSLLAMGEKLTEKTDSGAWRVDKAVLLELADLTGKWERVGAREPNQLADAVLHGKRAGKWRQTYVDTFLNNLDELGMIHPNINSLQARTGRMSITNPAVQTLPSGDWSIRRALLADPGHVMISTDFAAVELRVLASLGNVSKMKAAISRGEDLHSFTARMVFGDNFTPYHRKIAKGIAFGVAYGGGAATIARQTGAPFSEVKRALDAFNRTYHEIKQYGARLQNEAFGNSMVVKSATGRRLVIDRDRAYSCTNAVVQSTARDVLGQSMINADKAGLLPYMKLVIHDEILVSAPEKEAEEIAKEVERCMTFPLFGVPIEAEAEIGGRSWGSLYMKDARGKLDPELAIANDEWYAAHPEAAYARAA